MEKGKRLEINAAELTLDVLIKARELTQEKLAERIGVTPQVIRLWKLGKKTPRLDHAAQAATELGVSMKVFMQSLKMDVSKIPDDHVLPIVITLQPYEPADDAHI